MQDIKQLLQNECYGRDLEQRKRWYSPAAAAYNQVRPRYPQAIIDRVIELTQLSANSKILEIGCGPAIATPAFAAIGCSIHCIEPNPDFAHLAQQNCQTYPNVFIYLGIYWNNHHHLMQAVKHVNGTVLWANMHLLFWLSLIPFVTAWMGENHFATWPVALYGAVLLLAAIAYLILTRALIASHEKDSTLAAALGRDYKGKISIVIYAIAILLCVVSPWLACLLYAAVAIMWLIPDRRIERRLIP